MKRLFLVPVLGLATLAAAAPARAQSAGWLGSTRPAYADGERQAYNDARRAAYDNGYREGLKEGEKEGRKNERFRYEDEKTFQRADKGYHREFGDLSAIASRSAMVTPLATPRRISATGRSMTHRGGYGNGQRDQPARLRRDRCTTPTPQQLSVHTRRTRAAAIAAVTPARRSRTAWTMGIRRESRTRGRTARSIRCATTGIASGDRHYDSRDGRASNTRTSTGRDSSRGTTAASGGALSLNGSRTGPQRGVRSHALAADDFVDSFSRSAGTSSSCATNVAGASATAAPCDALRICSSSVRRVTAATPICSIACGCAAPSRLNRLGIDFDDQRVAAGDARSRSAARRSAATSRRSSRPLDRRDFRARRARGSRPRRAGADDEHRLSRVALPDDRFAMRRTSLSRVAAAISRRCSSVERRRTDRRRPAADLDSAAARRTSGSTHCRAYCTWIGHGISMPCRAKA